MTTPIVTIAALVALVVFAAVAKFLLKRGDRLSFRVVANPYFFSRAENRFYSDLAPVALGLDLLVFPKVGLNDIFKGREGARRGQYNRYAHMHVDYLLVTRKDYRPVGGIELDGDSHDSVVQKERDDRKNAVFKAAGLPLLRFRNDEQGSASKLRQRIQDAIGDTRRVRA